MTLDGTGKFAQDRERDAEKFDERYLSTWVRAAAFPVVKRHPCLMTAPRKSLDFTQNFMLSVSSIRDTRPGYFLSNTVSVP